MRGWPRRIGADLCAIVSLFIQYVLLCWWEIASLLEAINLEIQMEDRREKQRGEKGGHTLPALRNNLNTIQRMFKKAKD